MIWSKGGRNLRKIIVRVDPDGHPPGPPTDPHVQISRMRFLRS